MLASGVPVGSLLEAVTGWSVTDGWLAGTLIHAVVNAVTLPYLLVVWVLLYLDLRARAGRLDLDTPLGLGRTWRHGRPEGTTDREGGGAD